MVTQVPLQVQPYAGTYPLNHTRVLDIFRHTRVFFYTILQPFGNIITFNKFLQSLPLSCLRVT